MKTQGKILQTFIIAILLISTSVYSQEKNTRKERKAQEKQAQLERFKFSMQQMLDTAFIVPAQSFQFSDGSNFSSVDGTINFLKIDKTEGVLQLGNALSPNPGRNNLGGITVTGNVSNIRYSFNEKRNSLFMSFNLIGPIITARISISITGSENASVNVEGIFTGRGITLRGPVQAIEETRIFKGAEF